jgi:hypothetical protein
LLADHLDAQAVPGDGDRLAREQKPVDEKWAEHDHGERDAAAHDERGAGENLVLYRSSAGGIDRAAHHEQPDQHRAGGHDPPELRQLLRLWPARNEDRLGTLAAGYGEQARREREPGSDGFARAGQGTQRRV